MTVDVVERGADDAGRDERQTQLYSVLEQIARGLRVRSGELEPTLHAIVQCAVSTVPAADDAGVILVRKGELVPVATTGQRPEELDAIQGQLRSGPCFDTAANRATTIITDLREDARWPVLHERAIELGIAGMVCVPLVLDARTAGTLSLYSTQVGAFDDVDLRFTELFATHAALALGEAERADQLRSAIQSRDLLGQAKGILMERHHIGADEAFAMLASASQRTNHRVAVVATHLVDTGELLEPGMRPRP